MQKSAERELKGHVISCDRQDTQKCPKKEKSEVRQSGWQLLEHILLCTNFNTGNCELPNLPGITTCIGR